VQLVSEKKHLPHKLTGNYKGNWEAHIKPDLLIIWFEITEENEIILLRLGTHADLF
jgi:mRNA interferase YafQ